MKWVHIGGFYWQLGNYIGENDFKKIQTNRNKKCFKLFLFTYIFVFYFNQYMACECLQWIK